MVFVNLSAYDKANKDEYNIINNIGRKLNLLIDWSISSIFYKDY